MNSPRRPDLSRTMSANDDIDLMSPYGYIGAGRVTLWPDGSITVEDGLLIARARCCRDWPVLALTKMGRCGYCGQVPVGIGPW